MVDKEACKKLYRELKADIEDLDSVTFGPLWLSRAELLKSSGCWWHYKLLIRKGRDYLKGIGDYPGCDRLLREFEKLLNSVKRM